MYITIKTRTEDTIQFVVTGCSTDLINALRRIMIADIPTWAIELVQFEKNTTVIHDEVIAHRLGLFPLTCSTGPTKSTVSFTFDCTAGDEETVEWTSEQLESSDDNVVSAIDGIPIVKATRGQSLKFVAIAKRGTGFEHAKWSPVSSCFYQKIDEGFLFTVETTGSLDPVEVVQRSFGILREKMQKCMGKSIITYH